MHGDKMFCGICQIFHGAHRQYIYYIQYSKPRALTSRLCNNWPVNRVNRSNKEHAWLLYLRYILRSFLSTWFNTYSQLLSIGHFIMNVIILNIVLSNRCIAIILCKKNVYFYNNFYIMFIYYCKDLREDQLNVQIILFIKKQTKKKRHEFLILLKTGTISRKL
jgi:hypothetical protein